MKDINTVKGHFSQVSTFPEMNMIHLPTEVIESIVVSLDMKTLIRFSHVCTRFREVIVTRHFHNYLAQQV